MEYIPETIILAAITMFVAVILTGTVGIDIFRQGSDRAFEVSNKMLLLLDHGWISVMALCASLTLIAASAITPSIRGIEGILSGILLAYILIFSTRLEEMDWPERKTCTTE